jgi:hypothetical protein
MGGIVGGSTKDLGCKRLQVKIPLKDPYTTPHGRLQ